jgi:hypothetical protein
MWIFLNDAFISIVADQAEPKGDRLLVRARRSGDIQRVFPDAEVFQIAGSDYAHRAWIPRRQVAEMLAARVEAIDYPNFKNRIKDTEYHDAAMEVWGIMHAYQSHASGHL